jgi:hypothetical protein
LVIPYNNESRSFFYSGAKIRKTGAWIASRTQIPQGCGIYGSNRPEQTGITGINKEKFNIQAGACS